MRKFLVLATAAAAALMVAVPAMAATAASHDVLTYGKVGGTNVKVGAILKANLKKGTKAEFLTPGGTYVKCSSVSFTDKVTKNPRAKGTADENLTAQTYRNCTTNLSIATGKPSVALNRLPYKTTLGDSRGDPVTVNGTKATITLSTSVGTLHCLYSAKKSKTTGSASNSSQTIAFKSQPFTLTSGARPGCPTSGAFSATFGPVEDTSVHGDPHVFVN